MLNNSQLLGNWGEEVAREYLLKNNYKILDNNYKNYFGEIDIITKLKEKIIFIEVKTRSGRKFGLPEDSVNSIKQKKIIKASEKYMLDNKLGDSYQIDVIAIEKNCSDRKIVVRHLKNAIKYF